MVANAHLRKLHVLELGRALAAIAVVMHHASLASDAFTTKAYAGWFDWGRLGVDFFFVLSGFIIYYVHANDEKNIEAAQSFFSKRVRRIYTPYLPVTLVLIAAYLAFPTLSQGNRDWGLLTSLTLFPTGAPPALSVAWTLVYEMIFYVFFLTLYMTRFFWLIVVIWAIAIIGNSFAPEILDISLPVLVIMSNPLILEFFAGMGAAYMFIRLPPSRWYYPMVIAVLAILLVSLQDSPHRVLFGLSLAILVLGAALSEAHFKYKLPHWVLLLGASSYTIYLVHNPLQSLVARSIQSPDMWLLSFAVCCLAGIVAGIIYHIIYERPALKWLSVNPVFQTKLKVQ